MGTYSQATTLTNPENSYEYNHSSGDFWISCNIDGCQLFESSNDIPIAYSGWANSQNAVQNDPDPDGKSLSFPQKLRFVEGNVDRNMYAFEGACPAQISEWCVSYVTP